MLYKNGALSSIPSFANVHNNTKTVNRFLSKLSSFCFSFKPRFIKSTKTENMEIPNLAKYI